MAKTCMIAREDRRKNLVSKAKNKRVGLKEIIRNPASSLEDKLIAVDKLSKSARDESPIRMRTRCRICGRPRGVYRKFGLCRVHLREAAMRGDVPGLIKASW